MKFSNKCAWALSVIQGAELSRDTSKASAVFADAGLTGVLSCLQWDLMELGTFGTNVMLSNLHSRRFHYFTSHIFRKDKKTMEFNIFYKKKKDWFIGHIQEYPDYESQGRTLDELRENLIEIYNDINEGLVPDAEPFQLMEVAI